jgi:hypothetical protein
MGGGCYATTTQFRWEMGEAMRSLMGVGKKRRLRVDQPAILDELSKLAACTSGPNVCRGRNALASAPICLIRHVGWNKLSPGVSREASARLLRALKKRGSRPVFNVTAMERSILAKLFEGGGRGQLSGFRDRRPIERLVNKGFVERHTLDSQQEEYVLTAIGKKVLDNK